MWNRYSTMATRSRFYETSNFGSFDETLKAAASQIDKSQSGTITKRHASSSEVNPPNEQFWNAGDSDPFDVSNLDHSRRNLVDDAEFSEGIHNTLGQNLVPFKSLSER